MIDIAKEHLQDGRYYLEQENLSLATRSFEKYLQILHRIDESQGSLLEGLRTVNEILEESHIDRCLPFAKRELLHTISKSPRAYMKFADSTGSILESLKVLYDPDEGLSELKKLVDKLVNGHSRSDALSWVVVRVKEFFIEIGRIEEGKEYFKELLSRLINKKEQFLNIYAVCSCIKELYKEEDVWEFSRYLKDCFYKVLLQEKPNGDMDGVLRMLGKIFKESCIVESRNIEFFNDQLDISCGKSVDGNKVKALIEVITYYNMHINQLNMLKVGKRKLFEEVWNDVALFQIKKLPETILTLSELIQEKNPVIKPETDEETADKLLDLFSRTEATKDINCFRDCMDRFEI